MIKQKIILETKRLIAKAPSDVDFANRIKLLSDPAVVKYSRDGSVRSTEQIVEFL